MFELIAAPHTPFDPSGNLALEPLARLAAHLRKVGVHGVFVAGSTGEGHSLTSDERRRVAERWVEVAEGLRVIVQVGHGSLGEARDLARHASACGADAIGAAPPSWYPIQSAQQLADICADISGAAPDLPFFYYHIPALSGVQVPMIQLLDIARERIPNFAGLKYTHADDPDFQACVRDHGSELQLLWGRDERLSTGLRLGAHGAVGSTYSFLAPVIHQLIAAHAAGDEVQASELQSRVVRVVQILAARGYPAAAKRVMKFLGVDCGPVRLPLQEMDAEGEASLRTELEDLGFFDWIRGQAPRS